MKPIVRWPLTIFAILLILTGSIWSLQGLNILLGSPMSGQSRWIINGAIAIVIGIVLLIFANRRRSLPPAR
jgi:hypothetical protein